MDLRDIFCTEARADSQIRLSFPSCEELGIPTNNEEVGSTLFNERVSRDFSLYHRQIQEPSKKDPFSPYSMIPLPSPFLVNSVEPIFIRKRNERERERVRCVNDGYTRLKEHIPLENKDKRVSKVEILRTAITYIKHLQDLLKDDDSSVDNENNSPEIENKASDVHEDSDVTVFSDDGDDNSVDVSSDPDEPPAKRCRR